jgi:hypothetical protein
MGQIVDMVKTTPGHRLALLGRGIQLVRISVAAASWPYVDTMHAAASGNGHSALAQ